MKQYWQYYSCHSGKLTLVAVVFYVVCGRIDFINVITPKLLMTDYLLLPHQYLTGLAGSLIVIGISCHLSSLFHLDGNSLLPNIGRFTLGIYGVQTILLERITHGFCYVDVPSEWTAVCDYALVPLTGGLFCLLSYFVVRISSKSRVLNLFLYGNMYK